MAESILKLDQLSVTYRIRHGLSRRPIAALRQATLDIQRSETLAIVGESGSGKTTLGQAMLRLVKPSGGQILYGMMNLATLSARRMRSLRPRFQMIFQDPYWSLNPSRRIGAMMHDVLGIAGVHRKERETRAAALLADVGLEQDVLSRKPAAFSGGQRQRIAIARAIASKPELLVADEPTSSLDASIQSQIVNLLLDLKNNCMLTLVFISHDLQLVTTIADRVVVMYFGEIVEIADAPALAGSPAHPYTHMLLASQLQPDVPLARATIAAAGKIPPADFPSQLDPPAGCPFRNRCPRAVDMCSRDPPHLAATGRGGLVACHNPLPTTGQQDRITRNHDH